MTIELARFRVRQGTQDRLVTERPEMVAALRRQFPGCLAAYLTKGDDGEWLDVVLWRSRAEAQHAAREVNSVPEVRDVVSSHCRVGRIAACGGHLRLEGRWVAD
ncbi:antibiotic biosynthesis monooxygenase [Nonomuraea sp. NPDC049709]|uniref:antibiotic biosynthesis monooxygenase n=1 Tax=Nonomuraea sp. NPDC049709 TaxID=3154736 RepID=UPI0034163076